MKYHPVVNWVLETRDYSDEAFGKVLSEMTSQVAWSIVHSFTDPDVDPDAKCFLVETITVPVHSRALECACFLLLKSGDPDLIFSGIGAATNLDLNGKVALLPRINLYSKGDPRLEQAAKAFKEGMK